MKLMDSDGDEVLAQDELSKQITGLAPPTANISELQHEVGTFFGELQFLGVSEQRSETVEALVYCEVSARNLVATFGLWRSHHVRLVTSSFSYLQVATLHPDDIAQVSDETTWQLPAHAIDPQVRSLPGRRSS